MGKQGKQAAKIKSWKLPPRTPEWMPLDYSIWDHIETKALASAGKKENKASYALKLQKIAKGLSVNYVKKTCGSMKKRINGTYVAKGAHVEFD